MIFFFCFDREKDFLLAMLRFQEYEHTTVDPEGVSGLAGILAGQLSELNGRRCAEQLLIIFSYF